MSFEVDMDVGGSNLASGNQFATPQDPEVVAAAQPPSIDSIIKSFDKTEAKTPRKAEERGSPMTPSSEKKRGFNRLIDKIFQSPKSGKSGSAKLPTPMKSPAPAPSPARDAQGFAVPSPQMRTPNMVARQASIRHMNGLSAVALARQASIRGSFVPASPRGPAATRIAASPVIPCGLPRQVSNASIRLKKQSAWRNTTAITNPQMFGAPAPAAAAPAVETKEEKAVVATEVVPPIAAAPIATHAAIVLSRSIEQPAKEDEKVVEKIAAVDAVAEKKEEKESHKSHKKEEEKKEDLHKPHKKDDKTKEEKEKRRALKKKKVTEKKAAETVAETPERHTERKASPPLKVAVEKENGTGIRTKAVLSPSQSMITLSPLSNSPSRRALASHNNGSELPWLV